MSRTHVPDLPQTPALDSPEERRAFDHRAAEEAMESDRQAFAGAARHVGGVEFDDPGAFEIGDPEVDPDLLGRVSDTPEPAAAAEVQSFRGPERPREETMAAEPKNDRDEDRPTLRREWKGDRSEDAGELYNPTEVGASRMRQQGLGMGEEELRMQRDPAREYHTREETPGGEPPPKPAREEKRH